MQSLPFRTEHPGEFHRRAFVQAGFSGLLGFGLPSLLAGRAQAAKNASPTLNKSPRSVILIFLTGAPSHQDMFDLKPDAPAEVRGEFKQTASRTPGLLICEHLPRLAACSDKYAIVRSMTHGLPSHEHATHMVLTGIDKMPIGATHGVSPRLAMLCVRTGFRSTASGWYPQRRDAADVSQQRLWLFRSGRRRTWRKVRPLAH